MKGKDFMVGVILGSIIGAAIGLLMAPSTGEETREHLSDSARNVRDRVSESSRQFVESGRDLLEQGRSRVSDLIKRGEDGQATQEQVEG